MPTSLGEDFEQTSTEIKSDSALKDASVDGEGQDAVPEISVPESMESMPLTPPQLARSSVNQSSSPNSLTGLNSSGGYKALRRSNSVPPSSSPPTTGASSTTLFNTPTHSDTSFSPALLKLRQAVDEHRRSTKQHDLALAEHLKDAEAEKETSEWAALVAWVQISHQAETAVIKQSHAVQVDQLKQDRSDARRRLELRNRELRALQREMTSRQAAMAKLEEDHAAEVQMLREERSEALQRLELQDRELETLRRQTRGLNESNKEIPKGQEESDSEVEQRAAMVSGEDEASGPGEGSEVESEDGGVALGDDNVASIQEADKVYGTVVDGMIDPEHEVRYTREEKGKGKKSAVTTAEEDERDRQRLQKQQLLNDSVPECPELAIVPISDINDLQAQNQALEADLTSTRHTIAQLTSEAQTAKAELHRLKRQQHFLQLEISHCHAGNAGYRAALEDENPARTAHLDNILQRKDEDYADLERRADECAAQLAEKERQSAIDSVSAQGKLEGLEKEFAHRMQIIKALSEGKEVLKKQNDEVVEYFKKKIFKDDALELIQRDSESVKTDNTLLTKILQERDFYVRDAEKRATELRAEAVNREYEIEAERREHRRTTQSLNGLTAQYGVLEAKLEMRDEMTSEREKALEAQVQQLRSVVDNIEHHGADAVLLQRLRDQEAQTIAMGEEVRRVTGYAHHWRMRALEQAGDWCPMWNAGEVGDWEAEDRRWRGLGQEREVRRLEGVARAADGEVRRLRGMVRGLVRRVVGWRGRGKRRVGERGRW